MVRGKGWKVYHLNDGIYGTLYCLTTVGNEIIIHLHKRSYVHIFAIQMFLTILFLE